MNNQPEADKRLDVLCIMFYVRYQISDIRIKNGSNAVCKKGWITV